MIDIYRINVRRFSILVFRVLCRCKAGNFFLYMRNIQALKEVLTILLLVNNLVIKQKQSQYDFFNLLSIFNAVYRFIHQKQSLNLIIIIIAMIFRSIVRKTLNHFSPIGSQFFFSDTTPIVSKPKKAAKSQQRLTISQIIGLNTIPQKPPSQSLPSAPLLTTDKLLSEQILKRCSPLMRQILNGASTKNLSEAQSLTVQTPKQIDTTNKHDLDNFRHMLAGPIAKEADLDKFCYKKGCPLVLDVKYDGERTLISFERGQDLEMMSRNGKSQKISYKIIKQRIQKQLLQTDINSIKLDGQIVVVDKATLTPLPFGQLLKLKKIKDPVDDWQLQLQGKLFFVYIFDVVQLNGQNLMEKSLIQRIKHIPKVQVLKPAENITVHFPEQRAKIFDFFRSVLLRKYEGIIIKGQNDKYYTNQSRIHWKKLKRGFINTKDPNIAKLQLDLIVMGANYSSKIKQKKTIASFLMGTRYQGKIIPISNVGSGFIDDFIVAITSHIQQKNMITEQIPAQYDMQSIKADVYFRPQLIFQIHAQEFSVSPTYNLGRGDYGGLSLRFPTFKGIRNDKGVNQATSGEDILELSKSFNLQLPK